MDLPRETVAKILAPCLPMPDRKKETEFGADDTTLMAESEEELKSLLMKVKEESENVGLKLIQKMKIMASGPITSWQILGETMETMRDFILGGTKITSVGDCIHEIK